MTSKDNGTLTQLTGNPRFLDRLNAVCTVLMLAVLVAFVALMLQSRAMGSYAHGTIDLASLSAPEFTASPMVPAASEGS